MPKLEKVYKGLPLPPFSDSIPPHYTSHSHQTSTITAHTHTSTITSPATQSHPKAQSQTTTPPTKTPLPNTRSSPTPQHPVAPLHLQVPAMCECGFYQIMYACGIHSTGCTARSTTTCPYPRSLTCNPEYRGRHISNQRCPYCRERDYY